MEQKVVASMILHRFDALDPTLKAVILGQMHPADVPNLRDLVLKALAPRKPA